MSDPTLGLCVMRGWGTFFGEIVDNSVTGPNPPAPRPPPPPPPPPKHDVFFLLQVGMFPGIQGGGVLR